MIHTRHNMIYSIFRAHIEMGYYPKGSSLPTIGQLQEVYHVTVNTVRKAYNQLWKDGYIDLSPGRRTTVVYDIPAGECRRNAEEYYLARIKARKPLEKALHDILVPLFREGAQKLQDTELQDIREVALGMEAGNFYVTYYCGREMLLALNNRMALDLFQNAIAYYLFPHILVIKTFFEEVLQPLRDMSLQMVSACERENREELFHVYLRILDFVNKKLQSYMEVTGRARQLPEQIPFVWDLYRDRPQCCYSVAAKLLDRIYNQAEFVPGDFLPSYRAMAEAYSVSFSTIRRVAALLEGLGVLHTGQGLGIWVAEPGGAVDSLQNNTVHQIGVMFLNVVQILSISLEWPMKLCYPERDSEQRTEKREAEGIARKLRTLQQKNYGFRVFVIFLNDVISRSENSSTLAIWEKFYEIMLLALPILEARQASFPAVCADVRVCAGELIKSYEAGNQSAVQRYLREWLLLMTSEAEMFFHSLS